MSKKMTHKKRILLSFAIVFLLALVTAVVLKVYQQNATVETGSLLPNEELEASLYRRHAKKNGLTLEGASEERIREAAGGEITALMKLGIGNFPEHFSLGQTFESMANSSFAEGFTYWFYRMESRKQGNALGSKVETVVKDYYIVVDSRGNISETSLLSKDWGTFFEFAVHPWRVLPFGTDVDAVWCMDDFNNADGYYICYESDKESSVLVRYEEKIFLVPEEIFRTACGEAIELYYDRAEENGYFAGTPNPDELLSDYRRVDLEALNPNTPQVKEPLSWQTVCLIEAAVGMVLLVLLLVFKHKETVAYYLKHPSAMPPSLQAKRAKAIAAAAKAAEAASDAPRSAKEEAPEADENEPQTLGAETMAEEGDKAPAPLWEETAAQEAEVEASGAGAETPAEPDESAGESKQYQCPCAGWRFLQNEAVPLCRKAQGDSFICIIRSGSDSG